MGHDICTEGPNFWGDSTKEGVDRRWAPKPLWRRCKTEDGDGVLTADGSCNPHDGDSNDEIGNNCLPTGEGCNCGTPEATSSKFACVENKFGVHVLVQKVHLRERAKIRIKEKEKEKDNQESASLDEEEPEEDDESSLTDEEKKEREEEKERKKAKKKPGKGQTPKTKKCDDSPLTNPLGFMECIISKI